MVVLVAHKEEIVYHKSFGHFTYDSMQVVQDYSVYDVASVTKILGTTLAIMKLYDEKKIDLNDPIHKYFHGIKGKNIGNITIRALLTHTSGLPASIPIHKEAMAMAQSGQPVFSTLPGSKYLSMVTGNMYVDASWREVIVKHLENVVLKKNQYIYSDVGFILLGKIIENVTKKNLHQYLKQNIYVPLGLDVIGYNPANKIGSKNIPPTEDDKVFRKQVVQGSVHDPVAAMMGGVAGHAGLFSNVTDLYVLMQMLMNKGNYGGIQMIDPKTVSLFTSYQNNSRRGLGFDKPEKDNATRKDKYPCDYWSAETFGHTGFVGTAAWADPKNELIFIFLSNRTFPNTENRKLITMNVRGQMMEAAYRVLIENK